MSVGSRRVTRITERFEYADEGSTPIYEASNSTYSPSSSSFDANGGTSARSERAGSADRDLVSNASIRIDHEAFAGGLKAWVGEHFLKIALGSVAMVASVISFTWIASARIATVENKLDTMDSRSKDLQAESKGLVERVNKLESNVTPVAPERLKADQKAKK
ncbi:hypothetical protein PFX98_16275 [Paucibacter sediminis]|uniref:Uncharacterized protein n=1 Tax=Paucibacter sediminis TaxID=3019553 RepID=A0AA95SP40_9BURK|nr:hypothetical protein [Paucibacter sp. S2-9]WIT10461.1 hypothetical protein PFX98_16275 [Paucibacter sp. S2-9]